MSGSSTASVKISIEKLARHVLGPMRPRRRAWLLAALASSGSFAVACTLTQDDFEPDEVSGLEVAPAGPGSNGASGSGALTPRECPSGAVCCAASSDCASGEVCEEGRCAADCPNGEDVSTCEVPLCTGPGCTSGSPSCTDGVKNGEEPAIDCGGSCPVACLTDSACRVDGDCASLHCVASLCAEASCDDGVRNRDESDIDCGGSCASRCSAGAACARDEDCASGSICPGSSRRCTSAACSGSDCNGGSPSCSDGRTNGSETGVDCGGSGAQCPRCDAGAGCTLDSDCQSGACRGGACVLVTCQDGLKNGGETDTDCGGPSACPRCASGGACVLDSDCVNQSCGDGRCASCQDGVRNGGEADTDCGGPETSCGPCAAGASCQLDSECSSGACQDGRCCGGSQSDCTRCAERLSPSVSCELPAAGQDPTGVTICHAFLVCLNSNIDRCPTRGTPGCSGDDQLNDACPHNDFGGNAGTGLTRVNQILQSAGCQL